MRAKLTARDIAKQLGVSVRTVRRIAREGDVATGDDEAARIARHVGRPQVTDAITARVQALVLEDPERPPGEICRLLRDEGTPLGLSTVYRVKLYRPVPGDTPQALTRVWNSFRQEAGPSDTLYAMVSHDNGSTWMTPKKLPLPFVVSRIIDATDRHGNLHLAVRPRGETGKAPLPLHYVTLRHGVWGLLDSLRFGHTAVTPGLSFVAPDHLMLVWDSPRSAAINDSRVAPVSKYSLLRQGCAIHKMMRAVPSERRALALPRRQQPHPRTLSVRLLRLALPGV